MNKNENKRKQFVIVVLSVLAVCLVAGLFWRSSMAKGKQDVPTVQDGEKDSRSGKRAEAGGGKDATLIPTVPGNMTDQPKDEDKGEGTGKVPTPTGSVIKPEEDDEGRGESLPVPTQTMDEGTARPEEEDGKEKEDADANPESDGADDGTAGAEEPGGTPNPEIADTTPEPSPEVLPTKIPETQTIPGQQEKTDNQSESDTATNTKTDEGNDEDLNYRVNSPDEATPPPNPPADDKNTAPVENPDGDGNCQPEHTKPEQEETKKEESPSKGESAGSNEPSKKDDSSRGEPPSEGAIYVPGFGWVEYEGENSYDILPNAGTGDIVGDM